MSIRKKFLVSLVLTAAVIGALFSNFAVADDKDMAYKGFDQFPTSSAAPASGDFIPVYDASADKVYKIPATNLSILLGTTATKTEFDYLDLTDSGSGYAEVSKALVLDASGNITFDSGTQTFSTMSFTALPNGITPADLEYLDLEDPGTGAAEVSKALVLDASGNITFDSGTQTFSTMSFTALPNGITPADLEYLDLANPGIGAAEVSKALVLDASGNITFDSGSQTLYSAAVTDTLNLSSGVVFNTTLDLDIDGAVSGTFFFHSSAGLIWYCSGTGACNAVNSTP